MNVKIKQSRESHLAEENLKQADIVTVKDNITFGTPEAWVQAGVA